MKKKTIKTLILAGVMAIAGLGGLVRPVYAAKTCEEHTSTTGDVYYEWSDGSGACTPQASGSGSGGIWDGLQQTQGEFSNQSLETTVQTIVNVVLYIVGIVAVVMMIIGGFQYITSSGDAAKVTKAKNTILYGIVGLVIAVLAYAIVDFVLWRLGA